MAFQGPRSLPWSFLFKYEWTSIALIVPPPGPLHLDGQHLGRLLVTERCWLFPFLVTGPVQSLALGLVFFTAAAANEGQLLSEQLVIVGRGRGHP